MKRLYMINGTMDTMLITGAAMGLVDLALRANAAYTDMKKAKYETQENPMNVSGQENQRFDPFDKY